MRGWFVLVKSMFLTCKRWKKDHCVSQHTLRWSFGTGLHWSQCAHLLGVCGCGLAAWNKDGCQQLLDAWKRGQAKGPEFSTKFVPDPPSLPEIIEVPEMSTVCAKSWIKTLWQFLLTSDSGSCEILSGPKNGRPVWLNLTSGSRQPHKGLLVLMKVHLLQLQMELLNLLKLAVPIHGPVSFGTAPRVWKPWSQWLFQQLSLWAVARLCAKSRKGLSTTSVPRRQLGALVWKSQCFHMVVVRGC